MEQSTRKQIWKIELRIFAEFEKICKKHHLQYWAMGGTLLGAVRHKGFIPWDDDIDLIMPRSDYNKFLRIAPHELPKPYFLSTPMTEYKFYRTHAQLRDSSTTGFIKNDLKLNNNKGVFIDIFVLDKVPQTEYERKKFSKEIQRCNRLMSLFSHYTAHPELQIILKTITDKKCKQTFIKLNQLLEKYKDSDSTKCGHMTLIYREGLIWDEKDFAKTIKLPFENLQLNAPVGYKHILKCQYGADYMAIPQNPPTTHHGEIIFDPKTPYDVYIKKNGLK